MTSTGMEMALYGEFLVIILGVYQAAMKAVTMLRGKRVSRGQSHDSRNGNFCVKNFLMKTQWRLQCALAAQSFF